jgi:nicotinamide-nucleotide amidase
VAALFTGFSGSSAWFDRGFVTYSNQAKVEMVGVQHASLAQYGAVSEEVALEMAAGGVEQSEAACALSITGIAGPQGGTEEKPVGTVCFAWAGFTDKVVTEQQLFRGGRSLVRFQSVCYALKIANILLET